MAANTDFGFNTTPTGNDYRKS